MILGVVLRAFVVFLYITPLFAEWNYSFGIELIDHDIQNIYVGMFYALPNEKININKQAMIKLGYNAACGYYVFDKSVLLFSKRANV